MKSLSVGVVGYLGEFTDLALELNEDEVESVFTVPIQKLVDPNICKSMFFRTWFKISLKYINSLGYSMLQKYLLLGLIGKL